MENNYNKNDEDKKYNLNENEFEKYTWNVIEKYFR